MDLPDLPLTEWIVLSLLAERPRHGFAVVTLTSTGGEVGQYWHVSQPMVYRSIARLTEREYIESVGMEESERGPQRTVYGVLAGVDDMVMRWLDEPVRHLRDVRADLMVKLVLRERRGVPPASLVRRQRVVFTDIEASLERRHRTDDDFNRAYSEWRLDHARSALRLLDTLDGGPSEGPAQDPAAGPGQPASVGE